MAARKSCPKCKTTQRYKTSLEILAKKKRWIYTCVVCKALMGMDDYETGTEKDR